MIDLNDLNRYRITDEAVRERYGGWGDETCGVFEMPSPIDRAPMFIIASAGEGWDHVSISRKNRAPNQAELSHVHRLFFQPGEVAVQYFVPQREHVNIHENCLHLWRAQTRPIPMPPRAFV